MLQRYLTQRVIRWQLRGARPEADPMDFETGWILRLNPRARVASWACLLVFVGFTILGAITLRDDPFSKRALPIYFFGALSIFGAYYVLFAWTYRVELRPESFSLQRFLLPTRTMEWGNVTGIQCTELDHVLKIEQSKGSPIGIYLTLNGLSEFRRCLQHLAPTPVGASCSANATFCGDTGMSLEEECPAWNCSEEELRRPPFPART